MRYILADNQDLTRHSLLSILKCDEQNVISRASDKATLMELLREYEDSIVLLDYTLFDFADEASLLIVSERFAETQWVLISEHLTISFLRKIIYSSHAFSVVFKDESMKSIQDAIQYASEGRRYISQRVTELIVVQQQKEDPPGFLSTTEIEILKAIAMGLTAKEIANERNLSVHTVNTHRKNIYRKLGVNTAHEAVRHAVRAGWVEPSEFYI